MAMIVNGKGFVGIRRGTAVNPPSIVTNGLILYLDAGQTSSYPGTGTLWNDLSGNGYNGTLINGPTYSSANGGNIVFDGTNDYVNIMSNGGHIPNLTACTYNIFVKFNNFNKSYNCLVETYGVGGTSNYQITALVKNNGKLAFYIYNTVSNQSSYDGSGIHTLSLNTWYMLTFVFQGSTIQRGYVNALIDGSVSSPVSSMSPSSNNLMIGYSAFENRYPAMQLGQFQVYNRALSVSEITQNYNVSKSRFGL